MTVTRAARPESWGDVAIGVIATPTLLATTAGLLVAFVALITVASTTLARAHHPSPPGPREPPLFCLAGLAVLAFAWMITGGRL